MSATEDLKNAGKAMVIMLDRIRHLETINAELVEALEACERRLFGTLHDPFVSELYREVCAAIAKAKA